MKIFWRQFRTFFSIRKFLVLEFTNTPYRKRLLAAIVGAFIAIFGFSAPLGFGSVGELLATLSTVLGFVTAVVGVLGAFSTINEAKPQLPDCDFVIGVSPEAPKFVLATDETASKLPMKIMGDWSLCFIHKGRNAKGAIYVSRAYEARICRSVSLPYQVIGNHITRISQSYVAPWHNAIAALFCMSQRRPLINEKKLSQWRFPVSFNEILQFSKTSYLSSAITNELTNKKIFERPGRGAAPPSTWGVRFDFFYSLSPFVLAQGGWVFDEGKYDFLSNHIGITTLAVTNDGYALIFRVDSSSQIGAGEMSCAGSGSMDYSDLKMTETGQDFRVVLRAAMARELLEETRWPVGFASINQRAVDIVRNTIVIGVFLWAERGCKPEYLGVTRINADFSVISPDSFELDKSIGLRFKFENYDFRSARRFIDRMTEEDTFNLSTAAVLNRLAELGDAVLDQSNPDHAFALDVRRKIFVSPA